MRLQERVKKIYISRRVLDEVTSSIANQQPESGGLLMGPPDKDAITFFKYDRWGSKSGVTYEPNADKLSEIASEINRQKRWIIKGIVHSHPGSMSSLSFGDQQTIKKYFESNPGMPYFVGPIIYNDYNAQSPPNVVRLNGRFCNSMAVHLIHWDELNSQEALTRTIEIGEFIDLQQIPDSLFLFGSPKKPMLRNLTPREEFDLEKMQEKAPHVKPEDVNGTIVWYEWLREKRRHYQLAYWHEENNYQAAVVEGLEPNEQLSSSISSDGMIDLRSSYSTPCLEVVEARERAIKALAGYKPVKKGQIPKFLLASSTKLKKIATPLTLAGILFILLFILWENLGLFIQQENEITAWEYRFERIEGTKWQTEIEKLGEEGWELVFIQSTLNSDENSENEIYEFIFKRPKLTNEKIPNN